MITCDDDSVSENLPAALSDSNDKILDDKCVHPPQDTIRCKNCEIASRKIKKLKDEVIYWRRLYMARQQKPLNLDILKSDQKVKCYTGLPSKNVFERFGVFGDKVKKIHRWRGPSITVTLES